MNKVFEMIDTVEFNNKLEIIALLSKHKDKINFVRPVICDGPEITGRVERWM